VNRINVAQDRDRLQDAVNMVMNPLFTKRWGISSLAL